MSTLSNHRHALQPFLKDEALLSINPAGRAQVVKMLITLEPHGIFDSNFAYLYILTLSRHWYAKRRRRTFSLSRSFSEDNHTAWYIF